MPGEYTFELMPHPCFCNEATLREAIGRLGPALVYDLHVSVRDFLYHASEVRRLIYAPMAMQINVHPDERLTGDTWVLEANSRQIGSSP